MGFALVLELSLDFDLSLVPLLGANSPPGPFLPPPALLESKSFLAVLVGGPL
jgi:hypothetical protein